MRKIIGVWVFAGLLIHVAIAECPVMLVSGTGDSSTFTLTFMNRGKLPIRRLEFNCTPVGGRLKKTDRDHCVERNALFLPVHQYTVTYTYPGGVPRSLTVSIRNATTDDGHTWKPLKGQGCRVIRIKPKKVAKQASAHAPGR